VSCLLCVILELTNTLVREGEQVSDAALHSAHTYDVDLLRFTTFYASAALSLLAVRLHRRSHQYVMACRYRSSLPSVLTTLSALFTNFQTKAQHLIPCRHTSSSK